MFSGKVFNYCGMYTSKSSRPTVSSTVTVLQYAVKYYSTVAVSIFGGAPLKYAINYNTNSCNPLHSC